MRHIPDVLPDLLALALHIKSIDRRLSLGRHKKTAENANQRRLARSVGTEETEDFAAWDLQGHLVQRTNVAEVLRHFAHVDPDFAAQSARPFTPKSTLAAIPAFSFKFGSTSTLTPNTCSARCARVCTLRGVYSP